MNRDTVLAVVNDMPQDFDLDVLMEKLIFIEKIKKGLEQVNSGKMISHADVKHQME